MEERIKKLKDSTVPIKEKLAVLMKESGADHEIAVYIENHALQMQDMSVQELAQACYVGKGTIVRFAKKMGYSGYRKFRNDFIKQLESDKYISKDVDFKTPFNAEKADVSQIMDSLSSLYRESVDIIRSFVNPMELNKIAECIQKGNTLYIYAIGDSLITSIQFANRIAKLGYHAITASQYGDEALISKHADEKDIALFVTYSGNLPAGYAGILQTLKHAGTSICTFTANNESIAAKYADHLILIRNMEGGRSERIGTFYSQFVFEYLFNVLYSILYVKQN